jgi:tyrosine-specific transport protein
LLPAMMVYSGRYVKKISMGYRMMGGKPLIIILILLSFVGMWIDFFYR